MLLFAEGIDEGLFGVGLVGGNKRGSGSNGIRSLRSGRLVGQYAFLMLCHGPGLRQTKRTCLLGSGGRERARERAIGVCVREREKE